MSWSSRRADLPGWAGRSHDDRPAQPCLPEALETRISSSDVASPGCCWGAVLVAHGWQKLAENGIAATAHGFAGMGIPAAGAAAVFATAVELGGGVLILAGLATPVVAVLMTLNMIGAGLFAGHWTGACSSPRAGGSRSA